MEVKQKEIIIRSGNFCITEKIFNYSFGTHIYSHHTHLYDFKYSLRLDI